MWCGFVIHIPATCIPEQENIRNWATQESSTMPKLQTCSQPAETKQPSACSSADHQRYPCGTVERSIFLCCDWIQCAGLLIYDPAWCWGVPNPVQSHFSLSPFWSLCLSSSFFNLSIILSWVLRNLTFASSSAISRYNLFFLVLPSSFSWNLGDQKQEFSFFGRALCTLWFLCWLIFYLSLPALRCSTFNSPIKHKYILHWYSMSVLTSSFSECPVSVLCAGNH